MQKLPHFLTEGRKLSKNTLLTFIDKTLAFQIKS